MSLSLVGFSAEDGTSITLGVSNVPSGAALVSIWGGKRNGIPVLLSIQAFPFSAPIVVSTEAGNVYNFVAIASIVAVIEVSTTLVVYAKREELVVGVIDEVAEYMELVGLGVVGSSIFKFSYPQDQNEFYLLLPTGGLPPDVACGQETVSFSIQYRSLENRPHIGYQKLLRAKGVLHAAGNVLTTIRGIIEAQQAEPVYLGIDGRNKRCVHTMPFNFRGPKR